MKKTAPKNKGKRVKSTPRGTVWKVAWMPLLMAALVLVADQLSKYFVHHNIPSMTHQAQWYPYNGIGVFEDFGGIEFSIVHATNRGAAWGMLSDYTDWLFGFRILFILALVGYLIWFNKDKKMVIPLTLIAAGAIGNIIDYFVYGHVVDMLHFIIWGYDYPVFNIADAAIFLGVVGVVIITLKNRNPVHSQGRNAT